MISRNKKKERERGRCKRQSKVCVMISRRWDPCIGEVDGIRRDSYLNKNQGDMVRRLPHLQMIGSVLGKGNFGNLWNYRFIWDWIAISTIIMTKSQIDKGNLSDSLNQNFNLFFVEIGKLSQIW